MPKRLRRWRAFSRRAARAGWWCLRTERDEASANLEFETAAALHAQVQRVESVRGLAAELVRPLSQLRAVILQASANPDEVAVFLFEDGRLRGPWDFRRWECESRMSSRVRVRCLRNPGA